MEKILIDENQARQFFQTTVDKIQKYSSAVVPVVPGVENQEEIEEFALPANGLINLATLPVASESSEALPSEEAMSEDFAMLAKSVRDIRMHDAIPGSYWPLVIQVLEKFLSSSAAPRSPEARLDTIKPVIDLMKKNEPELVDGGFLDNGVIAWLGNIDVAVHGLLEQGGI